jgi:hypothetical protein
MHIMVGREILLSGHIPLQDVYSYSASGSPWRNHEWLAQVTLALAYGGLGVLGLKILKLLCATVMLLSLAVGLAQTTAPLGVQRLLLLAAGLGTMEQFQFRPQLFTLAMLGILMATLAGLIYRHRARLWPLIPMFALWANLHGGFFIGLLILVISSVSLGLREIVTRGQFDRAWRIAALTVGCALATLVNPLGIQLWPNVMHSVADPLVRSFITDWLPLTRTLLDNWHADPIKDLNYLVPLLLFIGFVVSLVAAPSLDDVPLVISALVLLGAAFYGARNISLAVVCLTIPFGHHLALATKRWTHSNEDRKAFSPNPFFVGGAGLVVATSGGLFSNQLRAFEPLPSSAVAFMKAHHLHGNILNYFDWGSYLIWNAPPESRVFIDGRAELVYSDRLLHEYIAFLYGLPGGHDILDHYQHDFVLVSPATAAYKITAADLRWKLAYRDSVSALFVRATSSIAKSYTNPTIKSIAPSTSFFP